jgi:hypothetical protein
VRRAAEAPDSGFDQGDPGQVQGDLVQGGADVVKADGGLGGAGLDVLGSALDALAGIDRELLDARLGARQGGVDIRRVGTKRNIEDSYN